MIVVLPLVILDFDEIKHYQKTGEHLAKPTVIDRVEAVRNHPLVGPWTERRTIRNCWKRVRIIPIISKEFIL
jgi:hypothetical protein